MVEDFPSVSEALGSTPKLTLLPGVVAHISNHGTWSHRQEDHGFEAGLCYIVRLVLQKK